MLSSAVVLAAAEPQTGWGNPIALLLAAGLFWGFTHAYMRWKQLNTDSPSPSDQTKALGGVNPQVSDTFDTSGKALGKGSQKGSLPVPASPAGPVKPVEKFVATRDGKAPTEQIVAAAKARFGASRSTVLRALRKHRKSSPDAKVVDSTVGGKGPS